MKAPTTMAWSLVFTLLVFIAAIHAQFLDCENIPATTTGIVTFTESCQLSLPSEADSWNWGGLYIQGL
jgi:hypothetical protein